MTETYDPHALRLWAAALFTAAGAEAGKAEAVAETLVEGDLFGHDTHGLALLAPYLSGLDKGSMRGTGNYDVVTELPAIAVWDGQYLPGPWLTREAVAAAVAKARICGTGTIAIRRASHIACLQAYLSAATAAGMVVLLQCSDPSVAGVAPFGGTRAIITPNPMAIGIPTSGEPILIDISASITTMGMAGRLRAAGQKLPGPWLIDGAGNPTDDPAVMGQTPPGTLLPLGGVDAGHKGFGLGLMVEALTSGLAGHGRADRPTEWGASVFVQVLNPTLFGGAEAFARQADHLVRITHDNPPRPGLTAVRLPGERAQARKRLALAQGLALHPGIMLALAPWAERFGLPAPAAR
jgi:LDH2 family malate/lactate/ureidoglycolate dehydrogenase